MIANPADALSLERMIGAPPRGIGDKTIEVMAALAAREEISLFEAMGRLETVLDGRAANREEAGDCAPRGCASWSSGPAR